MPATQASTAGDPFARVSPEPALVRDPFDELVALVRRESELEITCALKDQDWDHPTCHTCFEKGTAGRERLCFIGMEQERILDNL